MYGDLLEGLKIFLTFSNVLYIFAGCIVGMIIGILPGLSGAVATTLLLPITFYLEPSTSVMMLIGAYAAAVYSSSIGGTLYNIPGSGTGAATTVEGYPLTLQGKANDALAMACLASFVGGTIGVIGLFFTAPLMAKIALKFGPAELFSIVLLSLVLVSTVSKGKPLQGIMSCGIGLILGQVGQHSTTGVMRFVFGQAELVSGLNTVWVIIGLYAFPQLFTLGFFKDLKLTQVELKPWDIKQTLKLIFGKYRWLTLRASIAGTIIGAIPGTGGGFGSWFGYGEAKRTIKDEPFGNGALSAICGAESCNNAVVPGTMIPLVTLGIPGSGTSAVIMTGLLMAGVNLGPRLFIQEGPLVWSIILSTFMANVAFLVVGLFGLKYFTNILKVPVAYFFPIIALTSVVGAFVPTNAAFGVIVALVLGFVFYLLKQLDFIPAATILGFVIEPIIEDNYVRVMQLYKGDWTVFFTRPISLAFILLTMYMLLKSFNVNLKIKR